MSNLHIIFTTVLNKGIAMIVPQKIYAKKKDMLWHVPGNIF